jgi:ribosomal protein L37AE/L43A
MKDYQAVALRQKLLAEQDRPAGSWESLIQEMFNHYSDQSRPAQTMDGRTKAEVMAITVEEVGWRISRQFTCRSCGAPALLHPVTNKIWGCLVCGRSTLSVAVFFRAASFETSAGQVPQDA